MVDGESVLSISMNRLVRGYFTILFLALELRFYTRIRIIVSPTRAGRRTIVNGGGKD